MKHTMIGLPANLSQTSRATRSLAVLATATLALSACGGAKVGDTSAAKGSAKCDQFNLAVNAWVATKPTPQFWPMSPRRSLVVR